MYLFHATVHARPGMGESYVARTIGARDAITNAPGFVKRMLLKDNEHDDVYFYISIWRSKDDLEQYRGSEFVAGMREQSSLTVLTETVDRVECTLLLDDLAPAP